MKLYFLHKKCIFITTIVIGCAVALIIGTIHLGGKKEIKRTTVRNEVPKVIELNDNSLAELFIQNISPEFPAKNLTVHIHKDGILSLSADLNSRALIKFLDSGSVSLPTGVRLMMKFLPETVSAGLDFKIAIDSETAQFVLNPQKFQINGLDISGDLLPDELKAEINRGINTYLEKENLRIGSIQLEDGKILITPNTP